MIYDLDAHVAEIYDQLITTTEDVGLIRRLRILEPFCGSGRMLTPLPLNSHTGSRDSRATKRGQMPCFDRREVGPALGLITAHRRYLAEILEHFSGACDRSVRLANGEGEVRREMSVREIVMMLTDHLLEHVETIERTLARGGND